MKIESAKNSVYKDLLALTKSKGVREQKRCLVSGDKITREIAILSKLTSFWITTEELELPDGHWQRTITLSPDLFKKLDICGTKKPLLCVEHSEPLPLEKLRPNCATLYVALSDPTNLGALIRTCAAFEWEQIVLLKESAHPFLPRAIRAASGTCFATSFFYGPSIQDLQDPEIIALDMGGKVLIPGELKKDLKLLVGEEGQGVPKAFPGERLQLAISNRVESLNATVATSLLIYEWSKI